jgi:hypothetical protein
MAQKSITRDSETHAYRRLMIRGRLTRTFGGLAAFLAVIFLLSGIYILRDMFQNSITDSAAPVLAAAFLIALASLLSFYLLKPSNIPRHSADFQFASLLSEVQAEPKFEENRTSTVGGIQQDAAHPNQASALGRNPPSNHRLAP